MTSWPEVPLGELGKVVTGSTPKTAEARFYGGDVPFVTPAELDRPTPICCTPRTLTEDGAAQVRLIPANAIMVCCIGSLGKVGISGRPVATNQQINSIIFDTSLVWPRYGFHACRLLKPTLEAMAPATTVAIVSKSKFQALPIPLPPLDEQRRIAAILDAADSLRAKRRAALAKLDQLAQSIFIEMFGDPVRNTKNFSVNKLSLLSKFENGDRSSNYPSGDDLKTEGVLFLSTRNIIDNKLNLTNKVYITRQKFDSLTRGKARNGDLIITLRGTLGSCCIFNCDDDEAFINAQMMIIRPAISLSPKYLHSVLTSRAMRAHLQNIGNGAAVRQLTATQLAQIEIPTPPSSLQHIYSDRLKLVESLRADAVKGLQLADILSASLQHRAFRGEL